MSKQLLNAIVRLFAFFVRIDGASEKERARMKKMLASHLHQEAVDNYMAMFNDLTRDWQKGHPGNGGGKTRFEGVEDLCAHINAELTHQQKIVLAMELVQLIFADEVLSAKEEEAYQKIGEALNIDGETRERIKFFVTAREISDFDSPSVLIVKKTHAGIPMACKRLAMGEFDGFIAIMHLRAIQSFFVRYLGNSAIFINQVAAEPGGVTIFSSGSVVRGEKLPALYYSDVIGQFKTSAVEKQVCFEACDISFRFKSGHAGIHGVNLSENNGQLVGIMGASGSGKSTLINILNGEEKPTKGNVTINGIDVHREPEKVKGLIGYVPQDDLLMEELTVFENLYYAACLCFNKRDKSSIVKLVHKTLGNLGLLEVKDLKVGHPLQKVISGGQRKRLNIGLELLREPMILFVDEPTSGLSSRDSENIMDLLKELALKGKLVFTVIHQPSSGIFKMFDKLLIMDIGGFPVYYGHPVEAISYFKERANILDRQAGACPECGNVNPEQIFDIIEARTVDEYGHVTRQRKTAPRTWNGFYEKYIKNPAAEKVSRSPHAYPHIPGRLRQWEIFVLRDLKSKLANRQYLLINFLEAPLLAVVLAGLVRFHSGGGPSSKAYIFQENMNIPAYIFMAVIVALFVGLIVSAEEIYDDRKILKREKFLDLSRLSYLWSKMFILFLISAIQMFTFVLIGNWILGIRGMFFIYWLVLFSTACFANMLGLNISSGFKSVVTIYIVIPLLIIPQILLSGVVVRFDQLNPLFGAKVRVPLVGDLTASRWAYEALMVGQYKDNEFERIFYKFDKEIATADYRNIYYLPVLESKLEYAFQNRDAQNAQISRQVDEDIEVLNHELPKVLGNLHPIDRTSLDSASFRSVRQKLGGLRKANMQRQTQARNAKQGIIEEMTESPKKAAAFQQFKMDYTNDKVTSMVCNENTKSRIVLQGNALVQMIYPIYQDPEPENFLDFRTRFYVAKKYFADRLHDTPRFNAAILWGMASVLFIVLYFDLLRKLIDPIARKPKR